MARTPRHSKPQSDSITIDLDEKDVSEIEEETSNSDENSPSDESVKSNSDDSVEDTPQPEPVDAKKEKSSGSTFAAGIVGAAIALIGAGGLQWSGILPGLSGSQNGDITALERKISGLEENLNQNSSQIAEQLTLQPTGDFSALATRVDALETLVQNDNMSSLEALNSVKSQIDQLTSRIVNVETDIISVSGDASAAVLPSEISAEMEKLAGLNAAQAEKIEDLQAQIISLVQSSSQDENLSQTITELQKRLGDAETKISQPREDISIARSLAATSVRNAVNRGGTFTAELEAFSQIDPDHPAIAGLQPLAEKGVLQRSDIVASFGNLANDIIAADKDIDGETDIMTRLVNSAASMVKIRKVGEVDGDTAEAIVARIEVRLAEGNLEQAASEWAKLSEKAKATSQSFNDNINDRILAEKLSQELMLAAPASAG